MELGIEDERAEIVVSKNHIFFILTIRFLCQYYSFIFQISEDGTRMIFFDSVNRDLISAKLERIIKINIKY